jgi:hypothetical protein
MTMSMHYTPHLDKDQAQPKTHPELEQMFELDTCSTSSSAWFVQIHVAPNSPGKGSNLLNE